ncbi:hypothetical protein TNCV_4269501 [Trichonephila clavipes]|nr:hypothetical protein TNCV_4269501 [Trichonephila clavipes]
MTISDGTLTFDINPNVSKQTRAEVEQLLLHCLESAFRRYSSSKLETDESHLMRDQDCMWDDVGTPNQELKNGFVLPLVSVLSHCHPTTERQI